MATPRYLHHDEWVTRQRDALRTRLASQGVRPAPDLPAGDVERLCEADVLLAQFMRAARNCAGSVRAYASLISDAHEDDGDTGHWLARIDGAVEDLDGFVARTGALRICETERPTVADWADVAHRVADRCRPIGPCTVEIVDRTRAAFRQRAELVGRLLFHLVRNAMESAPRCSLVRVHLDENRLDGARFFHVRVTDEGPDWVEHAADDIWRPFQTTKKGHAGLGLTYAAVAAGLAGGAVGLSREAGRTVAHLMIGEERRLEWRS